MSGFRFIQYVQTPEAKHFGVAYVGIQTQSLGEIMLGFKLIVKKDGNGWFIADPAWKHEHDGTDEWKPWIMIDSNIAKARLHALIRQHVDKKLDDNHEHNTLDAAQDTSQFDDMPETPF